MRGPDCAWCADNITAEDMGTHRMKCGRLDDLKQQDKEQRLMIRDRYRQELQNQKLDLDRRLKEDKLYDAQIANDMLDY